LLINPNSISLQPFTTPKRILLFACFCFLCSTPLFGQTNSEIFWNKLQQHCGKAYAGKMPDGITQDDFKGKELIMHVRSCEPGRIRIPFVVGNNLSRTWVLTREEGLIQLKHDHRKEDGSEDKVTQYGGLATNQGFAHMQIFPADQQTASLLDYASGNVWWITVSDTEFTYNLRRMGTDRLVSVVFDLTKEVSPPPAPWGWEE
jgi:hypothetical protein